MTNKNYILNREEIFYDYFIDNVYKSNKIDIIVSFIKTSGVKLLRREFEYIKENNIPIRIITSTYLGITEPTSIYLLKDILGDLLEIKFFTGTESFHPKAYFFYKNDGNELYIGSSNMSKTAFTKGVEWNYRVRESEDKESFISFQNTFEVIYKYESEFITDEKLYMYSKQYKANKDANIFKYKVTKGEVLKVSEPNFDFLSKPMPTDPQIEALYELKKLRNDGCDKALVVAATGVGKTYLAAFDSEKFNKILFVAHRIEILRQAKKSFDFVNPNKKSVIYDSSVNIEEYDIVFATVQLLHRNLEKINNKYFNYVIVDEFHHSAANTYKKIINYFKPNFLLGLTATPIRTDNQDIFAICDYNLAYEVDLFTAINKKWLVPFHYYGIYDETVDYGNITYINGKYVEKELTSYLINSRRHELILKNYLKFDSKRAIGFCPSIEYADNIAKFFNENGISSISVHSKSNNREKALRMLENKELKIIFAVDLFNEGVDIKSLDMVLFLRPTESPIVFLQQLGRGLRLYEGKTHLTVLDFIGNYKTINLAPNLLVGKRKVSRNSIIDINSFRNSDGLPEDCKINFDMKIIDIYQKYNNSVKKTQDLIEEEYFKIKKDVGNIPTRVDMFTYVSEEIYSKTKSYTKYNFFRDYISFVRKYEKGYCNSLRDTIAEKFINMIERTSMTRMYKISVLEAFYNDGQILFELNEKDINKAFIKFYSNGQNRLDLKQFKNANKSLKENDFINLAYNNPVKYLVKSGGEFFEIEGKILKLNPKLLEFKENIEFINQFKDVLEFRRMKFLKDNLLDKKENDF